MQNRLPDWFLRGLCSIVNDQLPGAAVMNNRFSVRRDMSTITDAIFFLKDGQVVKEMMASEFEALLDGIVQAPEFRGQAVQAVHLQIDHNLKIRGLVFFLVKFTPQGMIESDWNVPFNQLLQSAGRGPDLGGGKIRLVCQSRCGVPWYQNDLWEPSTQTFQTLAQVVKANRLGILENEDTWEVEGWDDVPVLTTPAEPPLLTPVTAEPPVLTPTPVAEIPTLQSTPAAPAGAAAQTGEYQTLKKEFEALQAAYSVKLDKLQKERDELSEKNRTVTASLKQQAREHVESLTRDFQQDLNKKEEQLLALRKQLDHEQKRYAELKEQQVEQAASYQAEREDMLDQLQHGQELEASKIDALKDAFKRELYARVEAENAKVNEKLAMREVELFYREEQMTLLRDEVSQLKAEKQKLLTESGNQVLKALEDNGVTFVAFHVGVGHLTVPLEDVGRYLDERTAYLAERCGVSVEDFTAWYEHYQKPVCQHPGCGEPVPRVELAAQFEDGQSNRCSKHKQPVVQSAF